MKHKFLFLVIALLCSMQMMANTLVIERYLGAEIAQDIALIGKWVFVDTDLQLLDKSGNILASECIANVRKIIFSDAPTSIENIGQGNIVVYPNPTYDVLYIKGIEKQVLRIYDMQGRILQAIEGTQISVSNLPVGTYLLQIGTQIVRFIKQ